VHTASAPARPQALPTGTPERAMFRLAATELTCSSGSGSGPSGVSAFRSSCWSSSATPIGPQRVLGAQLVIHLGVAIIVTALVLGVGRAAYGAVLPRQPVVYVLVMLLAAVALLALGLLIAAIAPGPRVAQGIGSAIFFPLMFFAGLWAPIPTMPDVLRSVSGWTPLGAAVQSLSAATAGHGLDPVKLLVLAGYGVAFAIAAGRLFRWE
jgi:ABC-2 type transport system permease protein